MGMYKMRSEAGMRFKISNWNKFFDGSNKVTTLRLKQSKMGHHKAYAGSYYHPDLLGEFDIIGVCITRYYALTERDAVYDGFKTLEELKTELRNINGQIEENTILYQHWITDVERVKLE